MLCGPEIQAARGTCVHRPWYATVAAVTAVAVAGQIAAVFHVELGCVR